jgi:hypothetical protein
MALPALEKSPITLEKVLKSASILEKYLFYAFTLTNCQTRWVGFYISGLQPISF